MGNKIHLTSRTAIDLRENAARMKRMYSALAICLSVALCTLAIYLGIKWLPAAALFAVLTVALDVVLVLRGKSMYLMMIGQAICTEAASREIHAGMSESRRRERAITDLIDAKADVQRAGIKRPTEKPFSAPEKEAEDGRSDARADENAQTGGAMRRRRRSDGLRLIKSGEAK